MMRPVGKYILIELPNKEIQTKQGIFLLDRSKYRDQRTDIAKIVSVGDKVLGETVDGRLKAGEYVIYRKMDVEVDGKPYHPEHLKERNLACIHEKDVLSVIIDPPNEYRV